MSKVKIADTKFLQDVSSKDLEMIQMRYDGVSLDEMTQKFGYSDKIVVANYFTPLGRLRKAYDEYKEIMHQNFLDETLNMQKKAISPAIKVLIKNLTSGNGNISNAAAKYILDRELGAPKQAVEHSGEMPLQIIINAPKEERKVVEVIDESS
jgi:hypothetical protein